MADLIRGLVFNPLKFIYWGLLGTAGVAAIFAGRSGLRRLMKNNNPTRDVSFMSNGCFCL